jgi:hypothetical protein
MRRPLALVSFGSLVIVIAVFIATWGASNGAPSSYVLAEASPSASPMAVEEPPGVAVTDLGTLPVTASLDEEYTLRLKRVDLWLGSGPIEGHTHPGAFVLAVDSGAICYTLLAPEVTGTVVTAIVSDNVELPTGGGCPVPDIGCPSDPSLCALPRTDCADGDGCVLAPGDTVYMPAGSTLTQTGDADHWYGNVDPDHPAVVYMAEYQEEEDGAGCGSSCP